MPLPGIIAAGAGIAAVAGTAWAGISGNQQSHDAAGARGKQIDDADSKWSEDRKIISDESARLKSSYGETAAQVLVGDKKEAFDSWSHLDIWNGLNAHDGKSGVVEGDINAGADGWRRLVASVDTAADAFNKGVEADIETYWKGKTANAAMTATRTYGEGFKTLGTAFQEVANGIDLIQGYLAQAQLSVEKPTEVSTLGEIVGHIPGNGLLKLEKHRANEAEASAQNVMTSMYQPGAVQVDGQTPKLPEPTNPVSANTPSPSAKTPSPSSNGGTPSPSPTGVTPSPSTVPASIETPSPATVPATTDTPSPSTIPQSTGTPAYGVPSVGVPTTPATTNVPSANVPTSTIPTTGTPGSGRPRGTTPGSGLPTTATPGTPRTVSANPGTGNPTGTGTASSRGSGTGRNGMAGMPGMGGMGNRGGRGEDDDEHQIPDYLIQDRESELLGVQPRVLPPGGVIGG
ncbi:hypothetical protein ACFVMC_17120 [Nocardia sp. NPDC127579]|uniref:PPE domain-containing protein n=1 Tax=Nocardia sp. NPDC127579 TaxID=3345402 RepID=UPI00362A99C8